ncbi:hypothetical protein LJC59_00195 [Desulfovibrio sp. OttesenSCG-928-A18]|nr:hypothetical protein [Desulfovibrio sp. OttesenSCG-928-A18]
MTSQNLRPRICRPDKGGCGRPFMGGPRAWFCPYCREERRRAAGRRHLRRKRQGLARTIGEPDICPICGREYEVKGGNQRYCPECAPCVILENDAEQGLEWYMANREEINPARNSRRAQKTPRLTPCPVPGCGKEFVKHGPAIVCPDCRPEWRKKRQREYDQARRHPVPEKTPSRPNADTPHPQRAP